eukprot:TRINITY_DN11551_c0_g1_i1.p1 TRINITY_DN11551_c0_g1~~TRINITY_DN11551_c0_g1_i1.p1  ORF type:complete len:458 (+),score=91.52 TRINITY_DN11551_c0_g1_i1:31-1374(+)
MYNTNNQSSSSLIDYLLNQISQYYQDIRRIRTELVTLLQQYPALVPKLDFFPNSNNRLLVLDGTIPVRYGSSSYNIPVLLWVPPQYPSSPPVMYANPTSDMTITKNHNFVEPSGKCFIPYISNWNPGCSLLPVLREAASIFSTNPPVRMIKKPQPPPYGTNTNPQYQPNPNFPTRTSNPGQPNYGMNTNTPPPYPNPNYPTRTSNPGQPTGMNPMGYPPNTMGYPTQNLNQMGYPPNNVYYQNSNGPNTYPMYQPTRNPSYPGGQMHNSNPDSRSPSQNAPYEDPSIKMKRQLTEKLKDEMKKCSDNLSQEISNLMKESVQIENSLSSLEMEKAAIQEASAKTKQETNSFRHRIEDLNQWLVQNDSPMDKIDYDAVSEPSDILQQQELDLLTEIATITDIQYLLDRSLQTNIITLKEYMKEMRKISSKQYLRKALLKKVRTVINNTV